MLIIISRSIIVATLMEQLEMNELVTEGLFSFE